MATMMCIVVILFTSIPFISSQCENYNAAQNLHFPVPVGMCYYALQTLYQQISKQYICQEDMNGTKAVEYIYKSSDCSGQAIETGLYYPCESPDDHCVCTVGQPNDCAIFKETTYLECTDDCTCDPNKYQTYVYTTNLCIENENASTSLSCNGESIVSSPVSDCAHHAIANPATESASFVSSHDGQCYEKQCGDVLGPRIALFVEEDASQSSSTRPFGISLWIIDVLVVFTVFFMVVGGILCGPQCNCKRQFKTKYEKTNNHEQEDEEIDLELDTVSPVVSVGPTNSFSLRSYSRE
eukprot:145487_1